MFLQGTVGADQSERKGDQVVHAWLYGPQIEGFQDSDSVSAQGIMNREVLTVQNVQRGYIRQPPE